MKPTAKSLLAHLGLTLLLLGPSISSAQSTCSTLFHDIDLAKVNPKFQRVFNYTPYIYKGTPARGIEFEGNMPDGMQRRQVIISVVTAIQREMRIHNDTHSAKDRYSYPIEARTPHREGFDLYAESDLAFVYLEDGIRLSTKRNKTEEVWQVIPDHTAATKYGNDIEITSPIIRSNEDFGRFARVLTKTTSDRNLTTSDKAGIHVHIDFPNARTQEVGVLYWLMSRIEKQMKKRLKVKASSPRSMYIRSLPLPDKVISDEILKLKLEDYFTKMDEIGFHNIVGILQSARYHTLNILSLQTLGTVEFRLFPSVTDPVRIENYSEFSAALVKAVRERDPDLFELISKHADDAEIPLKEVEKIIGVTLMKTP